MNSLFRVIRRDMPRHWRICMAFMTLAVAPSVCTGADAADESESTAAPPADAPSLRPNGRKRQAGSRAQRSAAKGRKQAAAATSP